MPLGTQFNLVGLLFKGRRGPATRSSRPVTRAQPGLSARVSRYNLRGSDSVSVRSAQTSNHESRQVPHGRL